MGKKNMRVCLNMIVKDEAHIIRETLEHLRPHICYWVISDTGSTDGTQDIIRNFFKEINMPGELVSHKWEDFGTNRSLALKACEKHTKHFDYIWVFDADDKIVGNLQWPKISKKDNQNPDMFQVKYGEGFTYMRNQLFKATEKWRYVGVLHEYPECLTKKKVHLETINGDYYIDSRRLGARNKGDPKEKYRRDAATLEKGLLKEPENVRYMFYLAQSYMDAEMYEKAIEWYQKRANAGQWFEEVYYSLYRIATCMVKLGKPWPEVEAAFLKAWKFLPSRCEPLYEIAKYYRITNDFNKGYKYAKIGSNIVYPKDQVLFLFKSVYDWQIWDELAICASYIGKYEEAIKANEKILSEALFLKDQYDRIKKNLETCKLVLYGEKEKLEDILATPDSDIMNKITDLRFQGRHETVLQLSVKLLEKYGLNLESDTLTNISNTVTDMKHLIRVYYETSISGYYVKKYRPYILKICEKLLYTKNIGLDGLDHISANRRFVMPLLSDMLHLKNIKIDFEPPMIPQTNKRFATLNPSIVNFGDRYYLNIRCVNSKNDRCINYTAIDGSYNNKIVTRNFLLELDSNFEVLSNKELIDCSNLKMVRDSVQGFEDVNLFVSSSSDLIRSAKDNITEDNPIRSENDKSFNSKLHFFCCTYFTSENGVDAIHGTIDVSNASQNTIDVSNASQNTIDVSNASQNTIEITDAQIINYSGKKGCEKNWLGFQMNNKKINYLYGQDPLTILESEDGVNCQKVKEIKPNINSSLWRNSGGPISYKHGYLVISHEVMWNGNGRTYCHKFTSYDKDFNILKVSLPFKFIESNVEYCRSMTLSLDGQHILLGIGLEDKEFKILSLLIDEIESILYQPIPYF